MLYDRCPGAEERRFLLIALGLLGSTKAVVRASWRLAAQLQSSSIEADLADARATALALTCADPARASGLLDALEPVWPQATRPALVTAATRVDAGYVHGVIE